MSIGAATFLPIPHPLSWSVMITRAFRAAGHGQLRDISAGHARAARDHEVATGRYASGWPCQ